MGYYSQIGDGIVELMKVWLILLIIFVPLGIWKMVDILIWLFNNVHINFG